MEMSLLGRKTFCLITGGSRGIGKCLAVELSRKFLPDSLMVLVARDEQKLGETKLRIKESNSGVTVECVPMDLGQCDFEALNFRQLTEGKSFDVAMLIHNAGTIGDPSKKAVEICNRQDIKDYMDMNFTSFVLLNNLFLQHTTSVNQQVVINISSLCAVKGIPSFSLYSAGKAARDSFLRVLAAETTAIRVLNYAPGPIDTDMLVDLAQNSFDPKLRSYFKESLDKSGAPGGCLTAIQTVTKLISRLETNTFDNGTHLDYFDPA